MSFPIPVFNLVANVWNAGLTPAANPPSAAGVVCALYASPHNPNYFRFGNPGGGPIFSGFASLAKFPVGLLVFAQGSIIQPDTSEATYYIVVYDQRFYWGFPQAFHGAWCVPCSAAGALKYAYM